MDLYSKRATAPEGQPGVYTYALSERFRNQVVYIWKDAIGYRDQPFSNDLQDTLLPQRYNSINARYKKINTILCEELGFDLDGIHPFIDWGNACTTLRSFFMKADTDHALDVIQLMFAEISLAQKDEYYMSNVQPSLRAVDAAQKLNSRFLENAIGFRLEQGKIIRIDSEFLHAEAVEPAMRLMHAQAYKGAFEEFQLAQKYYRQGADHYDDCLTNCLKAMESTLQKIIELRKWDMPGEAKFDNLFTEVRKRGLFPPFLGNHIGDLKKFLQTVAVIRNEEGAHGLGALPNKVPDHLVAYQIHLTASAIVFLIRANEEFGKRKP
jgi:hypothetical protein